ncbi:unnamed protein product, partial [Brenthis ino]
MECLSAEKALSEEKEEKKKKYKSDIVLHRNNIKRKTIVHCEFDIAIIIRFISNQYVCPRKILGLIGPTVRPETNDSYVIKYSPHPNGR